MTVADRRLQGARVRIGDGPGAGPPRALTGRPDRPLCDVATHGSGVQPAVGVQQLPVDPATVRRAQERHQRGGVGGQPDPTARAAAAAAPRSCSGVIQPVSTGPGFTTFAVIRRSASSLAAASTMRSSAPLLAP